METTVTAIIAFASTNIDDLFILMALFTQTSKSFTKQHILAGQYLGIISLISLSIVGSFVGLILPKEYIGLLGFLPIYQGISKIIDHLKRDNSVVELESSNQKIANSFDIQALTVAAVTIANGGDNIGVYIPLFVNLSIVELIYTIGIFLLLVYIWVTIARYFTTHHRFAGILKKYNHIVFPLLLIALGIYILIESRTFDLLRH